MNIPQGLTYNNFVNIQETYSDFVGLIPRWKEVKDNQDLKKRFCNRNRNPLFDLSSTKFFKTGLGSEGGLFMVDPVQDHYVQRTKAVELIFNSLEKNPTMGLNNFIKLLKKYCSTVSLTVDEHKQVTSYCKKNKSVYNYQAYEACGIRVEGLSEIILVD